MYKAGLLVFSAVVLMTGACRPSSDRVAATESGAVATGGAPTSRGGGDPVAKGAENVTAETLPTNLVVAPSEREPQSNLAEDRALNTGADADQPAGPAPVIPAEYRGRWGLVPSDCTSTRGDAKGLIRIGERTIRFYESTATLKELNPAEAAAFAGSFSFTGEGQTWERDMVLTRQGETLTRTEEGRGFTYARCA